MHWLGLDIGGANIKVADGRGYAESQSFALWQRPNDLGAELERLIRRAPPSDHVSVTMTGELADCFATKREGVQCILDAVEQATANRTTRVYAAPGVFEPIEAARQRVGDVAAANWHAVARFSGRFAPRGPALFVDIGSTSCDVIPLIDGTPRATGVDDTTRLLSGELVYSGATRTPLCGIVSELPWRGVPCPVAREWFATTRDVYLLTGDLPENPEETDTADGRPATIDRARTRLARMICADPTTVTRDDATSMARAAATCQTREIAEAIDRVVAKMNRPPATAIVSGEGEFLARRALTGAKLNARVISLRDELGEQISRCAPAHAVAVLAAEATGV